MDLNNIDTLYKVTALLVSLTLIYAFCASNKAIPKKCMDTIKRTLFTIPFLGRILTIRKAGIVTFFASRDDISKYRSISNREDYIRQNTRFSFIYMGMWIGSQAKAEENEQLRLCIEQLLKNNIPVDLYFAEPDMNEKDLAYLSEYYSMDSLTLKKEIESCLNFWINFKVQVQQEDKLTSQKLTIFTHSHLLTCSLFLFNSKSFPRPKKQKIFLDQKLYKFSKEHSFAMEVRYKKSPNSLFNKLIDVFNAVKKDSTERFIHS